MASEPRVKVISAMPITNYPSYPEVLTSMVGPEAPRSSALSSPSISVSGDDRRNLHGLLTHSVLSKTGW